MEYEVIIGIEIHCELKTKTKMFSGAPVLFGAPANTCVNEIDLGHPGTMPCLNKQAVAMAVQAFTGPKMEIHQRLVRFDRKNYYYTDLPKGFQITQQFYPIGRRGHVEIETENGPKVIRIERLHMEEDTAKQFHYDAGTLIDFNRAGTPLVEIVSEPDIRSGREAMAYVEKLRQTLYYLGVSDVKMEEGSMRCDVNISLRPVGTEKFGVKTEIKNLNSISNVQKAVEYEIERQTQILNEGGQVVQETRRFDEASRTTISMRKKEGAVDYKYFPEPNIFPIQLDPEWIRQLQAAMPEMPEVRQARYAELGLPENDIALLVANKELADYYDQVMKHTQHAKIAANWVIVELPAGLTKLNTKLAENPVAPQAMAELVNMIVGGEISGKQAKIVFEEVLQGKDPKQVAQEKGMKQLSDSSALIALINQVLDEQPQSITDYKNGKDRAVGFLVGQVMKKSKGQANPAMTNKLIVEELKKRI